MNKQEKVFRNFLKGLFGNRQVKKIEISTINEKETKMAIITINRELLDLK